MSLTVCRYQQTFSLSFCLKEDSQQIAREAIPPSHKNSFSFFAGETLQKVADFLRRGCFSEANSTTLLNGKEVKVAIGELEAVLADSKFQKIEILLQDNTFDVLKLLTHSLDEGRGDWVESDKIHAHVRELIRSKIEDSPLSNEEIEAVQNLILKLPREGKPLVLALDLAFLLVNEKESAFKEFIEELSSDQIKQGVLTYFNTKGFTGVLTCLFDLFAKREPLRDITSIFFEFKEFFLKEKPNDLNSRLLVWSLFYHCEKLSQPNIFGKQLINTFEIVQDKESSLKRAKIAIDFFFSFYSNTEYCKELLSICLNDILGFLDLSDAQGLLILSQDLKNEEKIFFFEILISKLHDSFKENGFKELEKTFLQLNESEKLLFIEANRHYIASFEDFTNMFYAQTEKIKEYLNQDNLEFAQFLFLSNSIPYFGYLKDPFFNDVNLPNFSELFHLASSIDFEKYRDILIFQSDHTLQFLLCKDCDIAKVKDWCLDSAKGDSFQLRCYTDLAYLFDFRQPCEELLNLFDDLQKIIAQSSKLPVLEEFMNKTSLDPHFGFSKYIFFYFKLMGLKEVLDIFDRTSSTQDSFFTSEEYEESIRLFIGKEVEILKLEINDCIKETKEKLDLGQLGNSSEICGNYFNKEALNQAESLNALLDDFALGINKIFINKGGTHEISFPEDFCFLPQDFDSCFEKLTNEDGISFNLEKLSLLEKKLLLHHEEILKFYVKDLLSLITDNYQLEKRIFSLLSAFNNERNFEISEEEISFLSLLNKSLFEELVQKEAWKWSWFSSLSKIQKGHLAFLFKDKRFEWIKDANGGIALNKTQVYWFYENWVGATSNKQKELLEALTSISSFSTFPSFFKKVFECFYYENERSLEDDKDLYQLFIKFLPRQYFNDELTKFDPNSSEIFPDILKVFFSVDPEFYEKKALQLAEKAEGKERENIEASLALFAKNFKKLIAEAYSNSSSEHLFQFGLNHVLWYENSQMEWLGDVFSQNGLWQEDNQMELLDSDSYLNYNQQIQYSEMFLFNNERDSYLDDDLSESEENDVNNVLEGELDLMEESSYSEEIEEGRVFENGTINETFQGEFFEKIGSFSDPTLDPEFEEEVSRKNWIWAFLTLGFSIPEPIKPERADAVNKNDYEILLEEYKKETLQFKESLLDFAKGLIYFLQDRVFISENGIHPLIKAKLPLIKEVLKPYCNQNYPEVDDVIYICEQLETGDLYGPICQKSCPKERLRVYLPFVMHVISQEQVVDLWNEAKHMFPILDINEKLMPVCKELLLKDIKAFNIELKNLKDQIEQERNLEDKKDFINSFNKLNLKRRDFQNLYSKLLIRWKLTNPEKQITVNSFVNFDEKFYLEISRQCSLIFAPYHGMLEKLLTAFCVTEEEETEIDFKGSIENLLALIDIPKEIPRLTQNIKYLEIIKNAFSQLENIYTKETFLATLSMG